MAISKKIISKKIVSNPVKVEKHEAPKPARVSRRDDEGEKVKKSCSFCKEKTNPLYTDIATLKRYINDRGMILAKLKTGACSRHQRAVTREVKYARNLSMLPFTPKI